MRWVWSVVVLAAACGAKAPPQSLENLDQVPHRESPLPISHSPLVKAERPDIDIAQYVPDFHEELRWPLSGMNHPTLEPRFPVAQELAIGVDWQQLCKRGVQNRTSATQKELLSYLRGWCEVQRRDVDGACKHLTPLIGAITFGMTAAVRQDLANILVDQGDADKAGHWLNKHNIRDIQVLDLLAADYVEVGSAEDASAINRRAIDSDSRATDATKCRRLVKRIVFGLEVSNTFGMKELEFLGKPPKGAKPVGVDPLCARLYNKVMCWQNTRDCWDYHNDENIDVRAAAIMDAYRNWPGESTMPGWWAIGNRAREAIPLPGATELTLAAYEASIAAKGECDGHRATDINIAVDMIRAEPDLRAYEPRVERLAKLCPKPLPPSPISAPLKVPPVAAPDPASVPSQSSPTRAQDQTPPPPQRPAALAPKTPTPAPVWTPTTKP